MQKTFKFRCDDEILEVLKQRSKEHKTNSSSLIRKAILTADIALPKPLEDIAKSLSRVSGNLNQIARALNIQENPSNKHINATINELSSLTKQTITILKEVRTQIK